MAKKEHEKHTISPRSARLQRRVQAAVSACYMMLLTAQPAAAADTMWTRFSTIIADVYGQLVGISTIVGVTAASVALLVRMISRNDHKWRKRYFVDIMLFQPAANVFQIRKTFYCPNKYPLSAKKTEHIFHLAICRVGKMLCAMPHINKSLLCLKRRHCL